MIFLFGKWCVGVVCRSGWRQWYGQKFFHGNISEPKELGESDTYLLTKFSEQIKFWTGNCLEGRFTFRPFNSMIKEFQLISIVCVYWLEPANTKCHCGLLCCHRVLICQTILPPGKVKSLCGARQPSLYASLFEGQMRENSTQSMWECLNNFP